MKSIHSATHIIRLHLPDFIIVKQYYKLDSTSFLPFFLTAEHAPLQVYYTIRTPHNANISTSIYSLIWNFGLSAI